jgi:hypothetical protein
MAIRKCDTIGLVAGWELRNDRSESQIPTMRHGDLTQVIERAGIETYCGVREAACGAVTSLL